MAALADDAVRDRDIVGRFGIQPAWAGTFPTIPRILAALVHQAIVRIVPVVSLLLNLMLNVSPFASVNADP
jgi:hypothetical protein